MPGQPACGPLAAAPKPAPAQSVAGRGGHWQASSTRAGPAGLTKAAGAPRPPGSGPDRRCGPPCPTVGVGGGAAAAWAESPGIITDICKLVLYSKVYNIVKHEKYGEI